MKITIVGTGYVGLVSGVCLAEFGHHVTCLDSSLHKIERLRSGEIPIFEPGLEEMMGRNIAAGRLGFETQMQRALRNAEVVILAVGTPMRESDGQADLTQVFAAVDAVANALTHHAVIVTKSTVPVGTCRKIGDRIKMLRPDLDFDIASNPEFLREGSAIVDFMRPDRVVLGTTSDRAALLLSEMYAPLKRRNIPILQTGLESSELIKYASNGFLATKISFVNELAGLCERVGADMRDVSLGMGLDGRIGPAFLKAGPGYGGSCFPKDTHALARMGQENGLTLHVTEAVMHANELVKARMIQKIVRACGGRVTGKTVAVLGVTFKANTDDVRDAPSLTILPALIGHGARVRVVDPKGHRMGEQLLPGVTWHSSAYEAAKGADVLVVMTEWQDFDTLDLKQLAGDMRQPHMVDLRNIFSPATATAAGFRLYDAIGSKANWVEAPQTAVAAQMPPMDLGIYTPAPALNGQSRPLAAPKQIELSKPAP